MTGRPIAGASRKGHATMLEADALGQQLRNILDATSAETALEEERIGKREQDGYRIVDGDHTGAREKPPSRPGRASGSAPPWARHDSESPPIAMEDACPATHRDSPEIDRFTT